jgi:RimJ/RimL family protein N-acetyltransferase
MNVPVLTTTRLILRPLELADAGAIQKQFPQWEIVRFLVAEIPWPYPADGAERFIRDLALPAMKAGREWYWSIRPSHLPDQLIGIVSLMDKPDNNRGFWIDPVWQGRGFASEASAAITGCCKYAVTTYLATHGHAGRTDGRGALCERAAFN